MKTKTLLLSCLLLGIGLTVASAQGSKGDDNRAISSKTIIYGGWIPAYCDGFHEDLYSNLEVHLIDKYKDGEQITQISQWNGETMSSTGEVFKWSEVDKYVVVDVVANMPIDLTFHINLIGDQGSHYILSGTVKYYPPVTITIDKAVCIEKQNK